MSGIALQWQGDLGSGRSLNADDGELDAVVAEADEDYLGSSGGSSIFDR